MSSYGAGNYPGSASQPGNGNPFAAGMPLQGRGGPGSDPNGGNGDVTPPPPSAISGLRPGGNGTSPSPASNLPSIPPTSMANPLSFEGNPYALYSSYNFGSYPTNVQAKSEPLA